MEDKAKFIIMALLGIILVTGLFCLQLYNSKQAVLTQRDELIKEKAALSKKMDAVLSESRRLEDRVNSLNMDLEKGAREKDEIQKRFEAASREKAELENKLKSQPRQTAVSPVLREQEKPSLASGASEAYWAGVLKEKMNLESQMETLRGQLRTLQTNNEQILKDKNVLEFEAKNLAREKQDLERQGAYNQRRSQEMIDKLAQELVMEKNDKFQIEENVKSVKNENEILKRQMKTQGSSKAGLEAQIMELEKEKAEFERKLAVMDTVLKDNIMQLDNFKKQLEISQKSKIDAEAKKESVELAPIIIRPKQEAQQQPRSSGGLGAKGKIVSVNEANNFVIIDAGEEAGVRTGDVFQVYRQDNQIATIEVIQLRSDISACDIKKQTTPVMTGDTIR